LNLIIDIGNTQAKVAIFKDTEIIVQRIFPEIMICDVEQLLTLYPDINTGILSSTAVRDESLIQYLSQTLPAFIELTGSIALPFINCYKTPDTLGTDRIAAVAGASMLYPGYNILVIDAGSAIKYDFINDKNEYLGGNISPGLEMRFKALHTFTGNLPFLNKNEKAAYRGDDTQSAIISGVQEGILHEMKGYIQTFNKTQDNGRVVLTGGDAHFFADKLKSPIFVNQNLVLIGLNRILQFHAVK